MDIKKLLGIKKHPKLLKMLGEYEWYKAEEDELIAECRNCEKCDDLRTHLSVCRNK